MLHVFSSVCVLHVPQVLSLPCSCLFHVRNFNIDPVFEPIPSFLCVHVNVEMTSIVELFSDHFSFSVKSGMWTDQCCPFAAVACAACVLLIVSFTQPQIQNLLMKYCCLLTTSPHQTPPSQYGRKDIDILLNYFHSSTQMILLILRNQLFTLPLF